MRVFIFISKYLKLHYNLDIILFFKFPKKYKKQFVFQIKILYNKNIKRTQIVNR